MKHVTTTHGIDDYDLNRSISAKPAVAPIGRVIADPKLTAKQSNDTAASSNHHQLRIVQITLVSWCKLGQSQATNHRDTVCNSEMEKCTKVGRFRSWRTISLKPRNLSIASDKKHSLHHSMDKFNHPSRPFSFPRFKCVSHAESKML